ncbi:MAG TPA: hypothetical protein VMR37_00620 [Rhabdochlamydiaceae bacterium]|nr:hypothetical protein [Rhabdochlamydiaceae bacterium]
MRPRERRFLKVLLEKDKVFVRDLRTIVGALNPAQVAFTLRQKGWNIQTKFISMQDRDGCICHPGFYWLNDEEKERVKRLLEEPSGADNAAPPGNGTSKCSDFQISDFNRSKGEEK